MLSVRPLRRGFTLLELSLVLVVLSLLLAGVFAALSQDTRRGKQADLQAKLDLIEAAVLDFRRYNNRLPCPADGTVAAGTQYFGLEGVNTGACTTGSSYDGNGNRTAAASPGPTADFTDGVNTVSGVVPVKTLGLPDEAMFDPWGGRFTYAVDLRATTAAVFLNDLPTDTVIGSITVMDGSGNPRTASAILLVASHGPDGHGAFQLSGLRKATGATNSDELLNCHCDAAAATTGAHPFTATFTQHPAIGSPTDPLNVFDDTVRYYLRSEMLSATEDATAR